ncbi:MAG: hypothetical protein C4K47_04025 [Candidatus Thorarchaeota archaeon]|nr:MAG: hypothetical protein C4K47_04025 [Candidatus Thorarchaeota archaeon]
MPEELTTEIREYRPEDAESLAEMYNSWDPLWLGGFTQGVPFTAQRVVKQYESMRALAILIAIDKTTHRPVGSVTLLSHWRDTEAAYVGTLGVSPEALNKKVGKHLLLKCFEIAIQKGYTRVDLNTWAGNLRAVPLYKKMGLMWNPEGQGVEMQSYIPEILRHPLCTPFFTTNPDRSAWYGMQRRELNQAPDDYTEHGMAIYPYGFENGKNSLHVTVDRLARAITGIERVTAEGRLVVKALVSQHLTLCGIPSVYELKFENGTTKDIDLSVALDGFKSLHFDSNPQTTARVKAKKTFTWSVPFNLSPDAPAFRQYIKAPSIVTKLKINGQESTLRTGLRVKPVAEIQTRWRECRVLQSGKTTLPITVINNSSRNLTGKLMFEKPGPHITIAPPESDLELAPDGLGGATVTVRTGAELSPGTHDLWAYMVLSYEDESRQKTELKTGRYRIPLFCLQDGRISTGEDDRQRQVLIVGPQYTARLLREGGILSLYSSYAGAMNPVSLSTEIGPPFGLSPFRFSEREVNIRSTESGVIVSAHARHPERPLVIEDRWIALNSSSQLKHEVWVTNTSEESHEFQLRLNGRGGGISISFDHTFIPLATGIVESPTGNLFMGYPSVPSEPSAFSEQWIATVSPLGASGQVWKPDGVDSIQLAGGQIQRIMYRPFRLEGKETRCVSEVWCIAASSDWRSIQRTWRADIRGEYENAQQILAHQPTIPMIAIKNKPLIIPYRQPALMEFDIQNMVNAPLVGRIEVDAPEGWHGEVKQSGPPELEHDSTPLEEVVIEGNHSYKLRLTPSDSANVGFSVGHGLIRVRTPMEFSRQFTLLQLGTTGSDVKISEGTEKGLRVLRVNNGVFSFAVSPDYGGCLFSLKNTRSTELLCSAFPTPAPKQFIDNYYGGIQPIVWDELTSDDLFKAQTNKEKMDAKPCQEGGLWTGVEVSWTGHLQLVCRGVQFRLQYLTAPGSPILLVNWLIRNPTNAPISFMPSLFVDPGWNGVYEGTTLHTRWGGNTLDLRDLLVPAAVTPDTNSMMFTRGDSPDSPERLGVLWAGAEPSSLAVCTSELSMCGGMDSRCWLMPGDERVVRACLFIDPSSYEELEKVQAVLGDLL